MNDPVLLAVLVLLVAAVVLLLLISVFSFVTMLTEIDGLRTCKRMQADQLRKGI